MCNLFSLNIAYHVSKSKPYDADQAWRDHLERVARREPYIPSYFHTSYPFSRYPLYLYYSKRPVPERPYDPMRSYLDWFDRMNEYDKLFPSLSPVSRLLSPTPIKVLYAFSSFLFAITLINIFIVGWRIRSPSIRSSLQLCRPTNLFTRRSSSK